MDRNEAIHQIECLYMNNKNRTSKYTIGLDLSDRKVAICVLDAKGDIVEERSMPNETEHYKLLAKTYPKSTTVLETGSHSPWVSRLLQAEGLKPIVANARKLRSIYESDRKSDPPSPRLRRDRERATRGCSPRLEGSTRACFRR